MSSLENLHWRHLNSIRNYPFTDSSSLTLASGFIPQGWILDARVYARNCYKADDSAYIGRIVRGSSFIVLTFYSGQGDLLGEANVNFSSSNTFIPILLNGVSSGCIVVDPSFNSTVQALDEGEQTVDPDVARLVPSVCEYLPGPQVQSINDVSGAVLLRANEGIRATRLDESTIRIDIVGDPHFERYGCPEGANEAANDVLDVKSRFLENLQILHYLRLPSGNIAGPVLSTLKRKKDGSIVLALQSPTYASGNDAISLREARPAFRISTEGNTITFSLAGAS